MLRKILCAVIALAICVGVILADEVKGKVEGVDTEKKVVTVKVEGKEKATKFKLDDATKVEDADGKAVKDLKALDGKNVTVIYDKGDKDKGTKTKVKTIKVSK